MYQALYRKYRPKTFTDVVGQTIIVRTLSNSIINNKISHAYLFTGPRGTGKTSIAKIMAQIVNCSSPKNITPCNKCVSCTQINNKQNTDIIEIDAASNNGVDEIRDLRDKVNLVPSYGKYKVYIIDEVHMLTTAAFNALLKTLEEPPKHIIFILATTEPHKIPATILSRCQRYDFKKIGVKEITKRLNQICKMEEIKIENDAIDLIAKLSDGGMRDSIGLLDQLTAYTNEKICTNDVHEVYGTITTPEIAQVLINIYSKKINDTLNMIEKYDDCGKNLNKIVESIIEFLKNLLIFNLSSEEFNNLEEKKSYLILSDLVNESQIYNTIDVFFELLKSSKGTRNTKLLFDLSVLKIINNLNEHDKKEKIESKTQVLEVSKKMVIEKKIEQKKLPKSVKNKIEKLKEVRINNTLATFDKKQLLIFKKKIDIIKDLLMDPEYSTVVSLVLDGELKALGKNNMIFVYNVKNLEEYFNTNLIEIEKIFRHKFNINYKPIAVTFDEWEIIKNDFNKSVKTKKKKYKYIEEIESLENVYEIEKDEEITKQNNVIEKIFDDIIVYD